MRPRYATEMTQKEMQKIPWKNMKNSWVKKLAQELWPFSCTIMIQKSIFSLSAKQKKCDIVRKNNDEISFVLLEKNGCLTYFPLGNLKSIFKFATVNLIILWKCEISPTNQKYWNMHHFWQSLASKPAKSTNFAVWDYRKLHMHHF